MRCPLPMNRSSQRSRKGCLSSDNRPKRIGNTQRLIDYHAVLKILRPQGLATGPQSGRDNRGIEDRVSIALGNRERLGMRLKIVREDRETQIADDR